MKHYHDEYINRAIIECDNPSDLRALFLELLGDYVDTIGIEYQEKLAYIMNTLYTGKYSDVLIKAIEAHYDIRVILREFNVMLDL